MDPQAISSRWSLSALAIFGLRKREYDVHKILERSPEEPLVVSLAPEIAEAEKRRKGDEEVKQGLAGQVFVFKHRRLPRTKGVWSGLPEG